MLPMAPEPAEPPRAPPADGAQRFRVDGMDCAACARTVEKAVAALDGVRGADVSFGTATMLVDGDIDADASRRPSAAPATAHDRPGSAQPAARCRSGAGPHGRCRRRRGRALLAAVVASLAGAPRAVAEPLYLLSMAAGGWPVALRRRSPRCAAAPWT